jgi:hypothetical protein
MKNLLILFLFFAVACTSTNNSEDEEAEQKAIAIIEYVNQNHIQTFYDWIVGGRGYVQVFTRTYSDTIHGKDFSIWFYPDDGGKISIPFPEIEAFSAEFPNNIEIQSVGVYEKIQIIKTGNDEINVEFIYNEEVYSITNSISAVFYNNNPIDLVDSIYSLKTKLKINAISHRKDLGNFFELGILPQYMLTYVPDSLVLNPKYKEHFEENMQSGKYLDKNWNFRKLDEPFEY